MVVKYHHYIYDILYVYITFYIIYLTNNSIAKYTDKLNNTNIYYMYTK